MIKLCTATFSLDNPSSIETYLAQDGYHSWKKIIRDKTPKSEIIRLVKESGLKGKGGAGFLTGLKWSFINSAEKQRYLVCNSDESEPGTCKDRDILRYNPHAVIEGMLIACYAIDASVGYNYLRGEFIGDQWIVFNTAVKEAYKNNLIGNKVLNSDISIDIIPLIGAGAYIVGEETAMLESIEGKRGMPRIKPPFPAVQGLYGKPTIINNTETLATVPYILKNGDEWYKNLGLNDSIGVKMFCMSGHLNRPDVIEAPLGIPFSELLNQCGGILDNKKLKAVIPGGSSVPVVKGKDIINIPMDYESLMSIGTMLGSGGIIVMDESTCMVSVLERISRFYYAESCGQCTPCREGTGWLYKTLVKIKSGRGTQSDLDLLNRIANQIEGHCICALGDAAAMPVISFLKNFWNEFEYYVDKKESMVG
ncbi:MAG: NADH-quinone oxidoreductase subunit NuoF [Gammaproteobacteria bacterium]|nr:NADH-quinone oxidoreductase subunit NuoF [Gammaproteobacteria bacterium]MBL6818777.1 NADH-quinone oxidoreductase subunit NuoF [Gammaproteobacteria bacterium]MBL6899004.1 NADH-quinone oxidoreductase subunit NuoF [Gammaproteobacteria bacterium]